jgi:hypothetical protein
LKIAHIFSWSAIFGIVRKSKVTKTQVGSIVLPSRRVVKEDLPEAMVKLNDTRVEIGSSSDIIPREREECDSWPVR